MKITIPLGRLIHPLIISALLSTEYQLILQRVSTVVICKMLNGIEQLTENLVEASPAGWGAVFSNLWSFFITPSRNYKTKNIASRNNLNPHKKRLLSIDEKPKQDNPAQQFLHFNLPQGEGTQFEQFVSRLEANVNVTEVPLFMNGIVDAADLQSITRSVLMYIANNLDNVKYLNPNQAIRFDKHEFGLPFNVQITCSRKGKLRLFVETNTRMKDGTKSEENALLGEGSFKRVLKCYRIDLPTPAIWACSKVHSKIQDAVNEARLMNGLDHPHIPKMDIGHSYNRRSKIALYSKLAIGTLEDVIEGKIPASEEEKRNLMLQILSAVAFFNSKGIVHQDLKPINILIYRANDNSLRAKVNDFGLAHTLANSEEPGGTIGYESPETSAFHLDDIAALHEYFHKNTEPSFAKDVLSHMPYPPQVSRRPNLKSDSWSMGIILHEMLYGKKPEYAVMITQGGCGNAIVNKLLEPNVEKRATCEEALKELRSQSAIENEPRNEEEGRYTGKKRKLEF